jgi:hypothetical protein
MYETFEFFVRENNLNNRLRDISSDLCKYLDFQSWKIIMFNKDKLYGWILCSSENDSNCLNQEKIFFDKSTQDSYLNLILECKKVIYYKHDKDNSSEYSPLSPDANVELYFPLFSAGNFRKDVIGCLYLSKEDHLEGDIYKLISSQDVTSRIIGIQRIFPVIYMKYIAERNFFNLLHIVEDHIIWRQFDNRQWRLSRNAK